MRAILPQYRFPIFVACALLFTLAAVKYLSVNFIREPNTAPFNACINNLRCIDGAKQRWALERHKTTNDIPSWDDVRPYFPQELRNREPVCPMNGRYILGRLDEPPKCSIGGDHRLL